MQPARSCSWFLAISFRLLKSLPRAPDLGDVVVNDVTENEDDQADETNIDDGSAEGLHESVVRTKTHCSRQTTSDLQAPVDHQRDRSGDDEQEG